MKKRGYPRNVGDLMPKVNEQAIRLYGFIVEYFAMHEYFPAVREMCVFMDGRSESIVSYHLNVLASWKLIKRTAHVARGLRLLRPTERGLKPRQLRVLLGLEVVALDPPAFQERAFRSRKTARLRKVIDRKAAIRAQVKPFSG